MCSWCRCRLWCPHWRHFIQPGRGFLLFPTEGELASLNGGPFSLLTVLKVMWRRLAARSIATYVLTPTLDSFFCAMIAAITLKMLDPFGTGKLVLFQVTYDKVGSSFS